MNKRTLLKSGVAGLAASSLRTPLIAQSRSVRIGSDGGYFENGFKEHVYAAFTEATGITVESITQPNSSDWLVIMPQAVAAGDIPTDISLYARDTMIKSSRMGDPIAALDLSKFAAASTIDGYSIFAGVGAMSRFSAMVFNPNEVETPASWADFWDTDVFQASLGLGRNNNAGLLDFTAATVFDGEQTLMSDEGMIAELKPNVALWLMAESQMEQSIKNGEVVAGQYDLDVANLMALDCFPIKPTYPKERNVQDYVSWCLTAGSDKADEAAEPMNFSPDPAIQALMEPPDRDHAPGQQGYHRPDGQKSSTSFPVRTRSNRPMRRISITRPSSRKAGTRCWPHRRHMDGLVLKDVSKVFGSIRAVEPTDLTFAKGQLTAPLGPLGCGTTTLLRRIAGLEEPTREVIRLEDTNITSQPAHKRKFGMVFQSFALFSTIRARKRGLLADH